MHLRAKKSSLSELSSVRRNVWNVYHDTKHFKMGPYSDTDACENECAHVKSLTKIESYENRISIKQNLTKTTIKIHKKVARRRFKHAYSFPFRTSLYILEQPHTAEVTATYNK
jgi:hypothetical protein